MSKQLRILFFALISLYTHSTLACSDNDRDYSSRIMGYDPEAAMAFGEAIQQAFENQDAAALLQLMPYELSQGPRKQDILSLPFDDFFPPAWRQAILDDSSPCAPLGSRGFILGAGHVWFDKYDNGWRIIAINNPQQKRAIQGVQLNGQTLAPQCFSVPWRSGDNYETLAEHYDIADIQHFSSSPGAYYDNVITSFDRMQGFWCDDKCEDIFLAGLVEQCGVNDFAVSERGIEADVGVHYPTQHRYNVIKSLSPDVCKTLAPDTPQTCFNAWLVQVEIDSGGSAGPFTQYGIYGLYLREEGKMILPLQFFRSENLALNWLDNYH